MESTPQGHGETQDQLLRVLAHHLILIGKRTQILDSRLSEKQIIEDASSQWKRKATFEWGEMPDHDFGGIWSSETLGRASSCRYHLSNTHAVSNDCRPAGGFGTCMKDIDFGHFCCGPSDMDRLLADIEGLSLDSLPPQSLCLEPDSESHPYGAFPCGCSSISDTTISTPQGIFEDIVPLAACQCYQNTWQSQGVQTTSPVCQSCAPLIFDNIAFNDPIDMAAIGADDTAMAFGGGFDTTQGLNAQGNYQMGEAKISSTNFGIDPSLDHTLEQLSEVTTRLSSLKVV